MARKQKSTPIEYPNLTRYGGTGKILLLCFNEESCGHIKCKTDSRSKKPCPTCFRVRCRGIICIRQCNSMVHLDRIASVDKKVYLNLTEEERETHELIIYEKNYD